MTAFQALIYGIVQGFGTFLPISAESHQTLLSQIMGWPLPPAVIGFGLGLGALIGLLFYFRHDWASVFSSMLQVVLLWKRPSTLDDRMPAFLLLAGLPFVGIAFYLHNQLIQLNLTPLGLALSTAGLGIPMVLGDRSNRSTKNFFNWNWIDSILVGIFQILAIVPGGGALAGSLAASSLRNYTREAAVKFSYFAILPIVLAQVLLHYRDWGGSTAGFTSADWIPLVLAAATSFFASILAIGGFIKSAQSKDFKVWMLYRLVIGAGIAIVFWIKT